LPEGWSHSWKREWLFQFRKCRNFDYDRFKAKGKPVIHGHTPTSINSIRKTLFDPERKLVNIDAGCVYTEYPEMGNLIALDIDKWQLFIQANIEPEQ